MKVTLKYFVFLQPQPPSKPKATFSLLKKSLLLCENADMFCEYEYANQHKHIAHSMKSEHTYTPATPPHHRTDPQTQTRMHAQCKRGEKIGIMSY